MQTEGKHFAKNTKDAKTRGGDSSVVQPARGWGGGSGPTEQIPTRYAINEPQDTICFAHVVFPVLNLVAGIDLSFEGGMHECIMNERVVKGVLKVIIRSLKSHIGICYSLLHVQSGQLFLTDIPNNIPNRYQLN